MTRREEDPTIVGLVISFDPEEEQRRYEEEEEQRRRAKKLNKKKNKRDDSSSKCSGATASTSKSESINSTPVPEKIVTTTTKSDEDNTNNNKSKERKEKSSSMEDSSRKDKSESKKKRSKSQTEIEKSISKADLKKIAKKEAKHQKRAARNIQRIARGYLVRKNIEVSRERDGTSREVPVVTVESMHDDVEVHKDTEPVVSKIRLGARFRRAIAPRKKETDAANRLQNAFRLHRVRQFFKRGDKPRWRLAFANFFIFHLLAPLERMRQKKHLMQGPAKARNSNDDDSIDSSSSSDQNESLHIVPLYQTTALVDKSYNPDLLDVIPEESSHFDQVRHLLAPMSTLGECEESSVASDELRADMLSPGSPSTVTTAFTSGSVSPRRITTKPKKKYRAMHSSCPALKFDSV